MNRRSFFGFLAAVPIGVAAAAAQQTGRRIMWPDELRAVEVEWGKISLGERVIKTPSMDEPATVERVLRLVVRKEIDAQRVRGTKV